jgi:hypothetical protein
MASPIDPYTWEQIQKAVEKRDKWKLLEIGRRLADKPISQPLSADEVAHQILSMAPGNRPSIGRFILDLANKLPDDIDEE